MFVTILSSTMFVVFAIVPRLQVDLMLLPSRVWGAGEIWRVGTWPLANDISIWSALTIFLFWYFGSRLEENLGRTKMANLLVSLTLTLGVLAVVLSLVFQSGRPWLMGLGQLELVVLLLFIAEFPHIQFFFGIPGWLIALVLVVIPFLSFLSARDGLGLVNFVLGLALAAIVSRSIGLMRDYAWVPDLAFFRHRTRRPKKAKPARGQSSVVAGPWAGSSSQASSDRAQLDALLDKISAGGMDSLSKNELKQLEVLRRRLRGE
ncbi:MAG: DUF6576 domain-containing protein [Nocardioidaceae bacterium]